MAIDSRLITQSTVYSQNQLEHKVATQCPQLFLLDDFLLPELLEKTLDYLQDSDLDWATVLYQESLPRYKIEWAADTVVEELHCVMESLTTTVDKIYGKKTKFNGINIWKDVYPYTLPLHEDNFRVSTAIQIYLTSGPEDLCTTFDYQGQFIKSQYKINQGYLFDNSQRTQHGLLSTVPQNHERLSLYATWADDND